MKRLVIASLLCLSCGLGLAQVGEGGALHSGPAVVVDAFGNSFVAGGKTGSLADVNFGKPDIFLAKFDAAGERLWLRQFCSAGWDDVAQVRMDVDGNVVALGNSTFYVDISDRDWGAILVKFSGDGRQLWLRQLGDLFGRDLVVDGDGHYLIAGYLHEFEAGGVIKFDSEGVLVWVNDFSEPIEAVAVDAAGVSFTTGGGWLPVGEKEYERAGGTGGLDAFVENYDAGGEFRWVKQFGAQRGYWGRGVAVDAAGNAVVVGYGNGSVGGEPLGLPDAFVVKYSGAGSLLWAYRVGTTDFDRALAVAVGVAGDVHLTGYFGATWDDHRRHDGVSPDAGREVSVARYSAAGERLWLRTFGDETYEDGGPFEGEDSVDYSPRVNAGDSSGTLSLVALTLRHCGLAQPSITFAATTSRSPTRPQGHLCWRSLRDFGFTAWQAGQVWLV